MYAYVCAYMYAYMYTYMCAQTRHAKASKDSNVLQKCLLQAVCGGGVSLEGLRFMWTSRNEASLFGGSVSSYMDTRSRCHASISWFVVSERALAQTTLKAAYTWTFQCNSCLGFYCFLVRYLILDGSNSIWLLFGVPVFLLLTLVS